MELDGPELHLLVRKFAGTHRNWAGACGLEVEDFRQEVWVVFYEQIKKKHITSDTPPGLIWRILTYRTIDRLRAITKVRSDRGARRILEIPVDPHAVSVVMDTVRESAEDTYLNNRDPYDDMVHGMTHFQAWVVQQLHNGEQKLDIAHQLGVSDGRVSQHVRKIKKHIRDRQGDEQR